jgi:Golgi phosphoprotein 3 (GPP34)
MTRPAGGPRARVPALAGTGLLADDLYLIAHHERTGRPLLAPRAVGLGLAGALLGELVLSDAVSLTAGQVTATSHVPAETLTAAVAAQVAAEPWPRPAGDWLAFLARTAPAGVAGRLEQAGYLTAARSWRGQRWIPTDPDCAFAPVARIKAALDPRQPADAQAVALAGLAAACGLSARLALYLPSAACHRLPSAAGWLEPGLREVITQTQAAVDAAVLAHRI